MANENRFSLSNEEYARIKSLPKRTFVIGGVKKTGLFDQENSKFYATDENGELTGKVQTISHKPKAQKPAGTAEETPMEAPAPSGESESPANEKTAKKKGKKDKDSADDGTSPVMKKAKPIFIVLAVLVVVAVVGFQFLGGKPSNPQPSPSDPNSVVTTPNDSEDPGESPAPGSLDSIEVVQAIRDLIPGDEITPEDIQTATVSAEVFSQITLSGTQIYKWERSEYLLGKYITGYVPAGQYLAYDNVAPAVTFAANPWTTAAEGTTFVKVPIDDNSKENELLNYGAMLNLEIKKETVNQVATGNQGATTGQANVDGLNHSTSVEQSVTVDTYTMTDLTVCDILNANGESLYNKYCAYNGIPAGEQLPYLKAALKEDEQLETSLNPAYILVRVTTEQAEALGDLTAKGTSSKLSISESIDKSTDAKASFAANARSITATIEEAILENEQEAAEEAAAKEQAAQEALKQQQEQAATQAEEGKK